MHKKIKIISFYEFIRLNNLEQLKIKLYKFLRKKSSRGTILLAREGINGSISIKNEYREDFTSFINNLLQKKLTYKIQSHSNHVFIRLKVKIKKEIIKMGQKNIFPQDKTGNYVNPDEWDDLVSNKNVILLDTRNDYESKIGTFKGSTCVNSFNFTEFPRWVKENQKRIKNKKIAMFCTGGVRCEKASSFLIKEGFEDVCQLEGGIISYLKKTKNRKRNWVGECFVFDERVSLNVKLFKGNYDQCFGCRSPISENDKVSKNYKKGVYCPNCINKTTIQQKKNFEERSKQIDLAKKKGIKHLGS
jgi:UPF0176 protein|tara:strand:- start:5751 stop:6659 length:909 start_codon:yes stop_codon:yes gene_type:complete